MSLAEESSITPLVFNVSDSCETSHKSFDTGDDCPISEKTFCDVIVHVIWELSVEQFCVN